MKTSSAKQKGRILQQWVATHILHLYEELTKDDVRSTPMGVNGPDIQLSSRAKVLFPYHTECKNRESFAAIYSAYEQASNTTEDLTPLVFIKSNHKKPLAIINAEVFFKLIQKVNK